MNPYENAIGASIAANDKDVRVRRMQNIAFAVFLLSCAVDLTFRILKAAQLLPPSNYAYYVTMGGVTIWGFLLMYALASNLSSDFFAASQIMLELFFPVAVPVIMYLGTDNIDDYLSIYYLSMLISATSVYTWAMLLHNSRFRGWKKLWTAALPLTTIMNFIQYWNFVGRVEGRDQIMHVDFYRNPWCLTIMIILILVMPIGY